MSTLRRMLTRNLERLTRNLAEVMQERVRYEDRITANIAAEEELRRDIEQCERALEATRE